MASFYALPGLTAASQVGGWSSTSGGASNGVATPTTVDDVIFDANSGTARSITGTIQCKTLTASSSAAITLSTVTIAGTSVLTSSLAQIAALNINASPGTVNVLSGACLIGSLSIGTAVTISLGSNLSLAGALNFGTSVSAIFTTNNFNVTADNFSNGSTASTTLNLGSSIISLTGTNVWQFNGSLTVNPHTSTIKFANPNLSSTFFDGTKGSTVNKLNLWNASTTSVLSLGHTASLFFNNIRLGAGTTMLLPQAQGLTTYVASVSSDAGTPAIVRSANTGVAAQLSKNGTGVLTVNHCLLQDIDGIGSVNAVNCTNGGNVLQTVFSNTKFMAFF